MEPYTTISANVSIMMIAIAVSAMLSITGFAYGLTPTRPHRYVGLTVGYILLGLIAFVSFIWSMGLESGRMSTPAFFKTMEVAEKSALVSAKGEVLKDYPDGGLLSEAVMKNSGAGSILLCYEAQEWNEQRQLKFTTANGREIKLTVTVRLAALGTIDSLKTYLAYIGPHRNGGGYTDLIMDEFLRANESLLSRVAAGTDPGEVSTIAQDYWTKRLEGSGIRFQWFNITRAENLDYGAIGESPNFRRPRS